MTIHLYRCLVCIGFLSLTVHADLLFQQDYTRIASLVQEYNAAIFSSVPPPVFNGSGEPPPPPNDNFANRATLPGVSGTMLVNNFDATREIGEPNHTYVTVNPGTANNSIWFTWTASGTGLVGVDTRGTLFSTAIAVYRGTTLHALDRINNGISYVCFYAQAGDTFQIALSGATAFDEGLITLKYYQDSLSPDFTFIAVTNTIFLAQPSPDGSIVSYSGDVIVKSIMNTNRYGIAASARIQVLVYPQGLTFTDRKNNTVLNAQPPGIGTAYRVIAYDGKYVYIYDQTQFNLNAFKVSSKGLKPMGSVNILSLSSVILYKSKVYAMISYTDHVNPVYSLSSMVVFDRNLKKQQWALPFESGLLRKANIQKDVFVREQYNTYTIDLLFTSRSDEIHRRSVEYPPNGILLFSTDKKGGLFYWTSPFAALIGTGCPVSYLDKDGVLVLNKTLLEGRTDIMNYVPYTLDYVYGVIPDVSQAHLVAYRIGKNITLFNRQSVPDYSSAITPDSMLLAHQFSTPGGVSNFGFTVFDKKLKKRVWSEPQAEGYISMLDSKTAVRSKSAPSGSSTVYTYKIFTRKKTVADHTFVN